MSKKAEPCGAHDRSTQSSNLLKLSVERLW